MNKAWVYILKYVDGSYYTGHTTNLERRLAEHKAGEIDGWTQHRLPVDLVFAEEMPTKDEAFLAERRIKGWSRAKKEALIARDWGAVRQLAKKPRFRE